MPLEESGCGVLDRGKPPLRWFFFPVPALPRHQCWLVELLPNLDFFFFGEILQGWSFIHKTITKTTAKPITKTTGAMGGPDGQLRKRLGLREDEEVPMGE